MMMNLRLALLTLILGVVLASQFVAATTSSSSSGGSQGQLPPGWTFPSSSSSSSSSSSTTTTTTAVVTGGTKGIGKAIVEGLARHPPFGHCRVLTCSRNSEELQKCLKEWHDEGYNVHGVQADVSTIEGRDKLMTEIRNWLGSSSSSSSSTSQQEQLQQQLDILVNNVGTNIRKASHEYTPDEIATIWNTNYHSMFDLTMKCYPLLSKKKKRESKTSTTTSSVVMISSVAGVTCMKSGSPYASTKAAMNQLCGNLACEWGPSGIRVNCVAPWYINTPLAQQVLKDPQYRKSVLDVTPLGRVGESSEVAGLVVFLCLPIADWITGQVISVDGGFTRQGYYDSFYRG